MRRVSIITAALTFVLSGSALAQEWTRYASRLDLFAVNLPGEPKVENITYPTEYDITLPGRVYTVENARGRYTVTVVDYADTERIHTERSEKCKKSGFEADSCANLWRVDVLGATDYAVWKFIQRDSKISHYAWYWTDWIEGRRLQLVNPDKTRTFAAINQHATRLYILEGTVPMSAPPPALFQQSIQFLDVDLKPVRYRSLYSTGYSEEWKFPNTGPPRSR